MTTRSPLAPAPIVHVHFNRPGIASDRKPLADFSRAILESALRESGWRGAEMTVLYCSGALIQRLNREFRGIDETTDVLSFPASESLTELQEEDLPYLGDLAVCLPVCIRQAAGAGRNPAAETALLLVHGLLHLLGWDHDTPEKESAMWAETDRLIAASARARRPRIALRKRQA